MKLITLTLFALSCLAQDSPQVVTYAFNADMWRAIGLPGIPPHAKSHMQVQVKFPDPAIAVAVVIVKGVDNGKEFSRQSLPLFVNEWGLMAIFEFEQIAGVTLSEVRLVPMRADETISMKRGPTGLWTAQE